MTMRSSTARHARSSTRWPARVRPSSARCRFRQRRTWCVSSVPPTSTRTAASTSKCAPISVSSTSLTRRRRLSILSCGSTFRPMLTSRSSSEVTVSATTKNVKGLLGTKLGMTQVWDENNRVVPVTVIDIAPNVVTQIRTIEKDGYLAVQIAAGQIDPRKVTQPLQGHFREAGVTPRRHIGEGRIADAANYTLGQELTVDATFEAGQLVDVVGTSKGKGFAGVMKRHNFKGVSASHGAHRNHRKPGSIGASSTPSRVFKGMRMAGRMGGERVTVLNLRIHAVDAERGLLLVKGAVPGARGRLVFVRNAVKGA